MSANVFALICLVCFGLWGFVAKIATDAADWRVVFAVAQVPYVLMATAMLFVIGVGSLKWQAVRWPLVGGLAGAFGVLFFFLALDRSSASRIVPMTSVYPAITVLLSWLVLGESISVRRILGVALALAGVALLA